ncbi:cation-translocating P-type ATPase [Thioclava atlantica]|uniref:Cation-transporting ATPase n=1 Tax=Thioclava atlantica TaxID=1317124 RepID=A0A085TU22_9RHOB|nr:cation-transporting P-type ATPase [Thioclava atlantica]KFE34219.1 cation-transporting ATPase [Thioclava atlantica]
MTKPPREPLPDQARTVAEVLAARSVDPAVGLSDEEAARRLAETGPNRLVTHRRTGLVTLVARQFASPLVALLGMAAVLALWLGEIEEAVAIAIVLALNAFIGFSTELKATRSIEALRGLATPNARVRRGGHDRVMPARDLVPGDIVLLDAGDAVPADLRLIQGADPQVDESTLTGESVAVAKSPEPVAPDARLGERHSMLFLGTALLKGSARGVVVATGAATEIGHLSQLVTEAGEDTSPIERKLARLSGQLLWVILALSALIALIGWLTGKDARLVVEAAIALSVAAVPEGLPVVATLTLARGMWRMARQNALIERLSAVETLGATTVILTDKTGTLTENRMEVRALWLPSGRHDTDAEAGKAMSREAEALLEAAALCNDAVLDPASEKGIGDPMEVALLRAAQAAGQAPAELRKRLPRVRTRPFDTQHRLMMTVHQAQDGYLYALKGAPETVLATASRIAGDTAPRPFTEEDKAHWHARAHEMAGEGLRVLGCAAKRAPDADGDFAEGLVFLGLVGLEDPVRADVPEAIANCHRAGIRVIMVTGDHAATARSIGGDAGLLGSDGPVVEGHEIQALTTDGDAFIRHGIFARVTPAEKLDLVRAYQRAGEVVAMTGDGVNDAPALRQADIGVAMGKRGTDVARGAAAMVLLDDAFASIVSAIREGRVIFANIRRFASYLMACNLAEVLVVGLALAVTLPLPILPLQILYLNLITDVFPAFALALGEGERNVLDQPPRPPAEPILGRPQWRRIVGQSLLMSLATLAAFALAYTGLALSATETVTVAFLTLGFAQLWQVFNMRAPRTGVFVNEITRNPWVWAALGLCSLLLTLPPLISPLAELLGLTPLGAPLWGLVLGASLAPVLVWQAIERIVHRR